MLNTSLQSVRNVIAYASLHGQKLECLVCCLIPFPCVLTLSSSFVYQTWAAIARSFDVLLREGCGEVVVDWIVEVCGDPRAASADPLEAHLMDGRCVQQWAGIALQRCQARFMQAMFPLSHCF